MGYYHSAALGQAAITKYDRVGGLNNRNLFSHSSGDRTVKNKVPAGLVSDESSLCLDCRQPPDMAFPWCLH